MINPVSHKLTLVCLGDSTTAGTPDFFSPRERPPSGEGNIESQYAYWIEKTKPHWKVHNRGVRGQRTDQMLRRFPWDVPPLSPDIVIVLGGVNDINQGRDLRSLQKNLTALYEQSLGSGAKVLACTILPLNILSSLQKHQISEMNQWIQKNAVTMNLGFCDTHQALEDPKRGGFLISSPDEIHPDVRGYAVMGAAIQEAICRLWPDLS